MIKKIMALTALVLLAGPVSAVVVKSLDELPMVLLEEKNGLVFWYGQRAVLPTVQKVVEIKTKASGDLVAVKGKEVVELLNKRAPVSILFKHNVETKSFVVQVVCGDGDEEAKCPEIRIYGASRKLSVSVLTFVKACVAQKSHVGKIIGSFAVGAAVAVASMKLGQWFLGKRRGVSSVADATAPLAHAPAPYGYLGINWVDIRTPDAFFGLPGVTWDQLRATPLRDACIEAQTVAMQRAWDALPQAERATRCEAERLRREAAAAQQNAQRAREETARRTALDQQRAAEEAEFQALVPVRAAAREAVGHEIQLLVDGLSERLRLPSRGVVNGDDYSAIDAPTIFYLSGVCRSETLQSLFRDGQRQHVLVTSFMALESSVRAALRSGRGQLNNWVLVVVGTPENALDNTLVWRRNEADGTYSLGVSNSLLPLYQNFPNVLFVDSEETYVRHRLSGLQGSFTHVDVVNADASRDVVMELVEQYRTQAP